jgi:phospholipid/cholesterol/gamma-HCH transport system permease protein
MQQYGFGSFLNEVIFELADIKQNASINRDVLVKQILFTGYQALVLVIPIALILGAIIIVEGHSIFGLVGQAEWVFNVLISALVRDIGPFIVGFIIIARSGTAISTELGNMSVNKEIDALRAMGISPISYLVTPRVLGILISMIVLMIYFFLSGFFGGYLVSNIFVLVPFLDFVDGLATHIRLVDLAVMFCKVSLSGFLIGVISCFQGMRVVSQVTEVPQRTIKAVGNAIIATIVVNILVSLIYFFFS